MTQMITVECSDGTLIDVDKEMAINMSGAIRKRLEDKTFDENTTIVLDNISSNTLLKVLEFCSVHTSPQVPNLKIWDEKFVRLEPGELCELASAAYYLEIKPLVDLTCKAIAKLLKGKPPAEIRRTFNILYDFSPGDDVPPPTIRDKLRTKLHYKQKDRNSGRIQEEPEEDTRTIDELVSFIDGPSSTAESPKAAIKNGKKEKKVKKKVVKSLQVDSRTGNEISNSARSTQTVNNNNSKGYEINTSDTKDPQLRRPHRQSLSSKNNQRLYNMIIKDIDDDMWSQDEESDEDIDPELKAAQDKEVEEFRKRLESIQTNGQRQKITIPIQGNNFRFAKV